MAQQSLNECLSAMTPVKPGDDVADAASSARINAIQDAIRALMRGDNINTGPNIRKKSQDGWVILTGQPGGGNGGVVGAYPFKVTNGTDEAGNPVLTIAPGVFVTVAPTLYGESLTATPKPTYSPPNEAFDFLLRVKVDNTFNHLTDLRYSVAEATIVTDLDSGVSSEKESIGGGAPAIRELHIKWGDDGSVEADKTIGHFYLKIAHVSATREITQFLDQNFRTIAIIRDDVVILT
jgi:hypothetical protein